MKRMDRLTAVLIRLQTKRIVTAREIAERYGVSLRTVYRDIRSLEDAGVPIGSEPGRGYFLMEGYHLPPIMFNRDEAGALFLGAKLTETFTDRSVKLHFESALDKIKAVLDKSHQAYLNELGAHIAVLSFPPKGSMLPTGYLSSLETILGQNRVIRIQYHSRYKNEETWRMVDPIGLCFYNARWHLIGFCHLRSDYRDFRVDRIRALDVTEKTFQRDRHGSFRDLIRRLLTPAGMKSAVVRFNRSLAPVIQEQKYYFGFVEEKISDQYMEIYFLTASYEYFAKWILSFMEDIQMVHPRPLEALMEEYSRRLYFHYCQKKGESRG